MELAGNYTLNVSVGDANMVVPPQAIQELTITQDADRFLPTFKLGVLDGTGLLADIMPYDKSTSRMTFEFSRGNTGSELNILHFAAKRRNALSPEGVFNVEGVLDIPNLLTQRQSRVFSGQVKASLELLAKNDLQITSTEVGASLSYTKTLLQPNWTDAKFIRYLRDNLEGKSRESGYESFVRVTYGEPTFVFKSLDELLTAPIRCKLIVGHKEYQDFVPIGDYQVYDDSGLLGDLSSSNEHFGYFDYDRGVWVEDSVALSDLPALPELLLIDKDKKTDARLYTHTGRSNDFTANFKGRVRNDFYLRASNFVHMWASTWGMENIAPGDVVKVLFAEALEKGQMFLFQHSGLWMVKRVVHIFGSTYMTNLLLTRCGIDTDISTSLTAVKNRKRR